MSDSSASNTFAYNVRVSLSRGDAVLPRARKLDRKAAPSQATFRCARPPSSPRSAPARAKSPDRCHRRRPGAATLPSGGVSQRSAFSMTNSRLRFSLFTSELPAEIEAEADDAAPGGLACERQRELPTFGARSDQRMCPGGQLEQPSAVERQRLDVAQIVEDRIGVVPIEDLRAHDVTRRGTQEVVAGGRIRVESVHRQRLRGHEAVKDGHVGARGIVACETPCGATVRTSSVGTARAKAARSDRHRRRCRSPPAREFAAPACTKASARLSTARASETSSQASSRPLSPSFGICHDAGLLGRRGGGYRRAPASRG